MQLNEAPNDDIFVYWTDEELSDEEYQLIENTLERIYF